MRDIESIIERVQKIVLEMKVEQLRVTHPADDDGIWYFSVPGKSGIIQIESYNGMCPILIEQDAEEPQTVITVDAAVSVLVKYLNSDK